MSRRILTAGLLTLVVLTSQAHALVARPIALSDVLADVPIICTAKIDSLDPDKPGMVLVVDEQLKGKTPFTRMPVNLTGDAEAKKLKHREQFLKRVTKGLTLILFVNQVKNEFTVFAYTNGTWFQLIGSKADDSDTIRWRFTHCEPALRGTFKGTTNELKQVIVDGLAKKKAPPPPNFKEPHGLGPEIEPEKPEKKEPTVWSAGPPIAVIPTVVVGGPLAILAMLFPALFGGLLLVLRRWVALLTVASADSMLYMLYFWFRDALPERLQSPLALWIAMLLVAVIGTLWAWRRHLLAVQALAEITAHYPDAPTLLPLFRGESNRGIAATKPIENGLPSLPATRATVNLLVLAEPPRHGEHIALWIASALGLGGLLYCVAAQHSLWAQPWLTLLAAWIGIWGGTLYACFLRLSATARSALYTGLPLEGVILALATLAGTAMAGGLATGNTAGMTATTAFAAASEGEHSVQLVGLISAYKSPTKGHFDSSPLVVGDRTYMALVHGKAFTSTGSLHCLRQSLDESTGREQWVEAWRFDDDGGMKEIFSTPCLADGKIYVGEGFHIDRACKMYCIDADSGRKLWEFQTGSHAESSPCCWENKLYFGAGDDGLCCLDARDGSRLWNYAQERLHVDANPTVAHGHVFCSSGVSQQHKETAYFCLDALTGAEIWNRASDLPVWGSCVVDDDRVYFGLGNHGYVITDDVPPRGALLCVDAASGKKIWRYDVSGSVLGRPATDGQHVYFGAQDGFLYCLDRADGRVVWKQDLEGGVLAAPTLTRCLACGRPSCLYAVSGAGKLYCLDPENGKLYWQTDAMKATGVTPSPSSLPSQFFSSPTVVQARDNSGERHRIYFGCSPCDDFGYKAMLLCYEAQVR